VSRRAVLITAGAALALLALWFVLLWGPQGGRLDDAQARTDVAEGQNEELELRLNRLRAAQEGVPARMAELVGLQRAVPDDPQLAQFILDANQAASDAGVEFLSISPAPPTAGTPGGLPPVITLSITVTGGYFAVLDYLDRLDELPRIVVIDSLSLTPGDTAGGSPELSVAISGRMFTSTAQQATIATDSIAASDGATTSTSLTSTSETTAGPSDG
jgi:Tfp pilus assembly protein PilO